MRAYKINEIMNFERGSNDAKKILNIGLRQKRHFNTVEELSQWAYLFPEVCTEGVISKWPTDIKWYEKETLNPDERVLPTSSNWLLNNPNFSNRVGIARWFKNNIFLDTMVWG